MSQSDRFGGRVLGDRLQPQPSVQSHQDVASPGDQGDAGAAATIAVGTVSTGAAGSPVTVANSGSANAAVFDFSIPQGNKGDPGDCAGSEPLGACAAAVAAYSPIGQCTGNFEPIGCPAKSAIVPTEGGPRALYCMEAPQTWFFDVLHYPLKACGQPIDPLFLEVCEPNSVRVLAVHANGPVSVYAKLEDGKIGFRWSKWCSGEAEEQVIMVSVTIGGIRRGTMGNRFATKTVGEMNRNNAWWANAEAPTF